MLTLALVALLLGAFALFAGFVAFCDHVVGGSREIRP